ncbi:cupin domain-containing protein [Parafrigoribacterium soli]|uniref:cupin domain-containing protein n=1 Tax=Parafrigoribacterium soli TaxID=3144663 RepID=UPI0032EC12EF
MPINTTNDAVEFRIHGVTFHSFVRTATGAHQLGAWQAEFAPHTPGVPHRMSVEEVFRVLSGRLIIAVDDEHAEVSAGGVVTVPAGSRFQVSNETDEPASAWIVTPLGMRFVVEGDTSAVSPPWAQ